MCRLNNECCAICVSCQTFIKHCTFQITAIWMNIPAHNVLVNCCGCPTRGCLRSDFGNGMHIHDHNAPIDYSLCPTWGCLKSDLGIWMHISDHNAPINHSPSCLTWGCLRSDLGIWLHISDHDAPIDDCLNFLGLSKVWLWDLNVNFWSQPNCCIPSCIRCPIMQNDKSNAVLNRHWKHIYMEYSRDQCWLNTNSIKRNW